MFTINFKEYLYPRVWEFGSSTSMGGWHAHKTIGLLCVNNTFENDKFKKKLVSIVL
jgi:hypothetical protein